MRRITRPWLALAAAAALAAGSGAPATAQPDDDWGVKRDPFDKSVVARYKGILARDPHDGSALARLLEMYRRYRSVDQLVEEYEKALAKKTDDYAVLVVLGRLDKAAGEHARAVTRFEAAAKVKADDALLWIEIGTLHRNAGKQPEAQKAFDAALAHTAHKPTKMKALRALADLALAAGNVDGARAYFEQYIALEPKNVQLRIELGDALLAAGKHVDAIEAYKDADKLLGTDPARRVEVIARIGQALTEKGDTTAAVAEYRRAIKLVPRGYYLENELTERIIQIYSDRSQLPELLTELEREWPAKSRRHFEWATLGRLYDQTGSQDKAIAAYKAAVNHSAWEL
jgi:tetratricopeptide (TPR) repeat protein